jgi:signal transduction histidine kinase/ActR/RegA family two-component response regulator
MSPSVGLVDRQRWALLALVQLDKSNLETTLPRILASAAEALEVERVSYWSLAADRSRIRCEKLFRRSGRALSSGEELEAIRYPRYFDALFECRTIRASDARTDPRTSELSETYFVEHGITSMLDVPVWREGRLTGVLCHEHVGTRRDWLESEIDFALSVGGMLASALEAHARRQAESRYELLTTALRDLVWDWDLKTHRIEWSQTALEALRFAPGQSEPTFQWWREHVHPDDVQRVLDGLDRHAKTGDGIWRDEYRFRRGDGSWAIIVDRGVLERTSDGDAVRMVGAMLDVTEQRHLETRVALSDRMASVGTLAAGVAHEMNNPLTYIHGNLSYALRQLGRGLPNAADVRQALDEALSGVERVQRIVGDLKTLARPDEQPSAVEVRAALESALRIVNNELRHRATLCVELHPVPPVLGNAARLGQVFVNLLMNAAQAIPDGRADDNRIVVRTLLLASGRVCVEIEDTGAGIPEDALGRIFDPFFTTKRGGDGLGLGLAICHSIVTAVGGQLTLENNAERGARARIELEVAPDAILGAPMVNRAATQERLRARARVLVIDDVANVATTMRLLLEDTHDVQTTTRASEALEALRQGERWDVMLCDLMMPELNGMDFVAEVRRIDAALLPRIILMSGGAFTSTAREFLQAWPHAHMEKPFLPEVLLRIVTEVVDRDGA